MHNYRTFTPMMVPCECCHLENKFFFKTKHDRVICKGCLPHTGSPEKQQRRLRDHVGLYYSEMLLSQEGRESDAQNFRASLSELRDKHGEDIADLNGKIDRLRAALHEGATDPAVDRWLADTAVSDAREQREKAYRARDFAFAAVWQIDALHHLDGGSPERCSCGRAPARCKELEAIKTEVNALRRWEEFQVRRLNDGFDHGLPDNHPEVLRLSGTVLGVLGKRRGGYAV